MRRIMPAVHRHHYSYVPMNTTNKESKFVSTGRGGYGNVEDSQKVHYTEGETPPPDLGKSLAADAPYTTGRGGAGNIMHNQDKGKTRLAQDVDTQPSLQRHHSPMAEDTVGRGGAGNLEKARREERRLAKEHKQDKEQQQQQGMGMRMGMAAKLKNLKDKVLK